MIPPEFFTVVPMERGQKQGSLVTMLVTQITMVTMLVTIVVTHQ